MTEAERMLDLFRGHMGAHGTYAQEDRSHGRQKVEIKKTARTLRDPPSTDLWEQHIKGQRPLGIVPINEDGRCRWGAIDVDSYSVDHAAVARRIEDLRLPLVVCRSKSGGAHLFLFVTEFVPAAEMIEKLSELSAALGLGGSEIFPKQTEVLEERGDIGNWLNMPYFGQERYAVATDGRGLSLRQFLNMSVSRRQNARQFRELKAHMPASDDEELRGGPPCLKFLGGTKVTEGGRNNALFNFGVLAKRKFPDAWERMLESWNQKFIQPALSTDEVQIILRSLRKKDYSYRCKDVPICNHCDAAACRRQEFGVGSTLTPDIGSIAILDTSPPLFFVTLSSGGTVECTPDDLLSARAFQRAALSQLQMMIPIYKQETWTNSVQKCLETAVKIEAPRESSTSGAFHEMLETFCTDRFRARERDELLLGKPWHDEEGGRIYFTLASLMNYLDGRKFRELTRQQITTRIRDMKGASHFFNLRGKGLNCFYVPDTSFSPQTESHKTPRLPESRI